MAFILKKEEWSSVIIIVKKKNKIKRELFSKIEWACSLNVIKFEHIRIFEGCLRIIEHTNLAYVKLHRVIIKDKLLTNNLAVRIKMLQLRNLQEYIFV